MCGIAGRQEWLGQSEQGRVEGHKVREETNGAMFFKVQWVNARL